ncbi:hypothetical protein FZC76_00525 [Sutcliffiella horikoshii]|uniref:Uncharacterized protein n=1 Tax=Sutcliffiella horikoshii TaxID=79883 RepID=A0A5D4T866_9BACI|nr:hypothetical protein [Sutcliffiella horikoshii]TYS70416.1 hypothetical protein FZC76_00525 [Sutcliffiella horikoshii]
MKRFILLAWNVVTGLFVLLLTLWLAGPGISETENSQYNFWYVIILGIWLIGLRLQFNNRFKTMGIIVSLFPLMFYLVITCRAIAY